MTMLWNPVRHSGEGSASTQKELSGLCNRMLTRHGPGARLAKRQGSRQDATPWKAGARGARFEGQLVK